MRTLSLDQIREQDCANTALSEKVIASVGGVEIPRSDFEIELAHVRSRYQMAYGENAMASDQGQRLLNNLKVQIAHRLVDERIQLQLPFVRNFSSSRCRLQYYISTSVRPVIYSAILSAIQFQFDSV